MRRQAKPKGGLPPNVKYGLICLALLAAIAALGWLAWYSPWAIPSPIVHYRTAAAAR